MDILKDADEIQEEKNEAARERARQVKERQAKKAAEVRRIRERCRREADWNTFGHQLRAYLDQTDSTGPK